MNLFETQFEKQQRMAKRKKKVEFTIFFVFVVLCVMGFAVLKY